MANTKIFDLDSLIFTSDLSDEEMVNISGGVLAPTCIDVSLSKSGIYPRADVINNCSSRQRVKTIWAFGRDSQCNQLEPGGSAWSESGAFAQFDRLEAC
ncbi:hypothetical protein LC609_25150 [Nostoc sp. XA013]|nr:hypothetical protein [Nostoc sp. XA013]